MMVIVSITKLEDGRVQIKVAQPHHSADSVQTFPEAETRKVLLGFGFSESDTNLFLTKLLPQLSVNQELKFAPVDIPQHELVSRGFHIEGRVQVQK